MSSDQHPRRNYLTQVHPTYLHYTSVPNSTDTSQHDQEVIDYLKQASIDNIQKGWTEAFDPRQGDTVKGPETEELDITKINEAFYIEAEEVYDACSASGWYPLDHVLAKVDVTTEKQ